MLPIADVLIGIFINCVIISNQWDAILTFNQLSCACFSLFLKLILVSVGALVEGLDVYLRYLRVLAQKHPVTPR